MTWNHNKLWGAHPAVTSGDDRNSGQKAADLMKRMLACWAALILVLMVIVAWMIYNSHLSGAHAFDVYPWILLNLCLSCFAALQCFILLIANKRGEQIAAELAQHTYENTQADTKLLEENTNLTREIHAATKLLQEIQGRISPKVTPVKKAALKKKAPAKATGKKRINR